MGLHRYRHVARVTLETTGPLHVGSGDGDLLEDQPVVRDPNGLPAIPGSSIAGALRAAWGRRRDDEAYWFGASRTDESERSRVLVSWAQVHDGLDRPVPALLEPEAIQADPLLRLLVQPLVRQHVRISHRGVAEDGGKFDRSGVPAGARFTFEVEIRCEDPADAALDEIIALLGGEDFRLGGATRAGRGSFEIRRVARRSFDLSAKTGDLDDYLALPAELSEPAPGLEDTPARPASPGRALRCRLALTAEEPWRVGGEEGSSGREADMTPFEEERIDWVEDRAVVERRVLVPATALKGALRHRTAFHLRVLAEEWAHVLVERHGESAWDHARPESLEPLTALFGCTDNDDGGTAGHVYLSDAWLAADPPRVTFQHVSLDRFSGGPMLGQLFSEEAVAAGTAIDVDIVVDPDGLPTLARRALDRALDDLCRGELHLGAGFGRGLGWFAGTRTPWEGPDVERWNEEDAP